MRIALAVVGLVLVGLALVFPRAARWNGTSISGPEVETPLGRTLAVVATIVVVVAVAVALVG